MSIYRQRLLAQQALIPRPIAAWSAKGKTNEDEDRAILKDLTGNGHDITLNNMAFSDMSGYGGYQTNFRVDNRRADIEILGTQHWLVKSITTGQIPEPILKEGIAFSGKNKTVTIRVSGLTDSNTLYVRDPQTQLHNGLNVITFRDGQEEEFGNYFVFNFSDDCKNIEIEILPEYPDALVFDGVDDYGVCKNMPIQNDFTLIIKRDIFSPTNFCTMSKSSKYGNGAFILDETIDYADGYHQWSYGLSTQTTNNNFYQITFMTPTSYNQSPIVRGVGVDTHFIYLGIVRAGDNRHFKGAFYCAYLFGRTLSEQEIKTFIRANIDPLYMLPSEIPENEPIPDCYYDFSLGSNEDENRDTIVDYSGNGNNAVAHNFAWGGMSGYGGFSTSFTDWNKWLDRNVYSYTNNKLTITEINSKYTFIARRFYPTDSVQKSFKIRVSGISNSSNTLSVRNQNNENITQFNINIKEDGIYEIPEIVGTADTTLFSCQFIFLQPITEKCNITIELLPEYPGALVLDGTDDYISLDAFDSGFKTMFMLCRPLKDNTILYDQRYVQSGNTTDDFAVFCGWSDIAYNSRNINGTYINGKQNTSIICYNLLNKKHLIHIKSELTRDTQRPTIGSHYKGSSYFAGMAIYKFLGFKEYLDEEQIQYVINKYNLLEGVDELESSEV